jgi:multidrug efflux pump subunit AcrA (membrane-fusion protein)
MLNNSSLGNADKKMFTVLRRYILWQIVVLLLVVSSVGSGVYGIYDQANLSSTPAIPANAQLVQVQGDNLNNTLSALGSLVFVNTEELTFGSSGTDQEANVEKDNVVKKGDVLAPFDSASILSLQEAVDNARA